MSQFLNDAQKQQVKEWLASHEIVNAHWHRDFSDASVIVKLLEKFYPRMVESQYYRSCSSFSLKYSNWERLNQMALKKLNLRQSKHVLDHLARGTPGYVDKLLYDLMSYIRDTHPMYCEECNVGSNHVIVMTDESTPRKFVDYALYEEATKHVHQLEETMKKKCEKCEELRRKLKKMSSKVNSIKAVHKTR